MIGQDSGRIVQQTHATVNEEKLTFLLGNGFSLGSHQKIVLSGSLIIVLAVPNHMGQSLADQTNSNIPVRTAKRKEVE